MSKIGVYWSVMHRRANDYDYFKRLQPSVFKIMDGGPPDYQWARDNLPNSLIVARDWALSEQHDDMLRDPTGTGKRHAQEWNVHANRLGLDRTKTLILGINEPKVWNAGVPEALRRYTIAICDEATRLFLRVGAMQLGVGWPNNRGPDTPPDWTPWHGVGDAIRRNNGALVTHEYWADSGPMENWGWWAGRTLKCPWNVPIVIGETGVDMFVKSAQFQGNRGWHGHMTPERYAQELAEYVGRMSVDSRFLGCTVFASDYANREWASFDVEPAYQAILQTPIPVYPPVVTPPSVPVMYVTAPAGANVRTRPVDGDILVAVPYGEAVQVYGADGLWSRVTYGTHIGWMLTALLGHTVPGPIVVQPPVVPTDKWQRSLAFVRKWEGGWADNPADPGGATMKGITIGTYTRWRQMQGQPVPTKDDLRAISDAEVESIFREWYWIPSGAAMLPWPDCLAVFDTAIIGGADRAKQFVAEVGTNYVALMARRLDWHTRLIAWPTFGAAWTRRCADLLREGGKQ